jgi:hypothetical protein
MKYLLILLTVFISNAHASDSVTANQVITHLKTLGYKGKGFDKLPDNLRLEGWSFKKISDKYYDVRGPEGISKRNYEYVMDASGVDEITMAGDTKTIVLYKKNACLEIYKASLQIKAEESLQDTLTGIVQKYKIKDPKAETKEESDKWYARNYAKNCKEIFGFNEEKTIKAILRENKADQ